MVWPRLPKPDCTVVMDYIECATDILDNHKVKQTIESRPFTQTVQILLPKRTLAMVERKAGNDEMQLFEKMCPIVSSFLGKASDAGHDGFNYFLVNQMPIHLLFHKVFIDSYVKKGKVFAISINSRIESDNCMALDANGLLTLNITERTYHRVGLEGRKSLLYKKNVHEKHIIELNLLSELSSKVESKYFKRTFSCLQNSGLKFDILIKWEPSADVSDQVSPLSIRKFFEFIKWHPGHGAGFMSSEEAANIQVRTCAPSIRTHKTSFPLLPNSLMTLNWPADECSQHNLTEDILEWSGAQCCSISTSYTEAEADASSFGFTPGSGIQLNSVACTQISGLFSPMNMFTILGELCSFQAELQTRRPIMEPIHPFVVVIANGFEECPLSWSGKNNEHGKQLTGENIYSILLSFHDASCLIYRLADGFDFSIEKL